MPNMKYIVIVGSIMSGLGKGILSASIGKVLQARGLKVEPLKFDGYLNVDCGTMNPLRHGEVFVMDDGSEGDMDFGTYERFLNLRLGYENSLTGGKIFKNIIEKERRGDFLGKDVQFVPDLTGEIKRHIKKLGEKKKADVMLVEVGGTVGDLENGYFLEAMRELNLEEPGDVLFIQLTYVPSVSKGEQKTKPTQHANKLLRSLGINPKIIVCREDEPLTKEARKKISLFCSVPEKNIIDDPLVKYIYEIPLKLYEQKIDEVILKELNIKAPNEKPDLEHYKSIIERIIKPEKGEVNIVIAGKYTAVKDAYVSVNEALIHAGAKNNVRVNVDWLETTDIEDGKQDIHILDKYDGVIVPGGFGSRGLEGKIQIIQYCRENKIPFLGLCLGLQMAVIEYARNVCGLKGAHTTEVDPNTPYPVIYLLPEQRRITELGGTMRLGAYECVLKEGTRAYDAYGEKIIAERHRHRYEVNEDYVPILEKNGLIISGRSKKGEVVEMIEWSGEGFGIATQAHPELKSTLEKPAPLFVALVEAAMKKRE